MQFRLQWNEPGFKIETMHFEYTSWPLAQVMEAEISPTTVDAGSETDFVWHCGFSSWRRFKRADVGRNFRQCGADGSGNYRH